MREKPAKQWPRDEEQIVPPDYTAPIGPEDDEGQIPLHPDDSEEIVGPNPDVSGLWPGNSLRRVND